MLQSGNAFLNQARVVAAPEELSKYDLCLLDGPMAMYACGGAGASVVKLITRWNNIVRGLLVLCETRGLPWYKAATRAKRRGMAGPDAVLDALRRSEQERSPFDEELYTTIVPALRDLGIMCKGCLGEYDTQAIFMQRQRSDINVLAISRDIDLVAALRV